MTHSRGASSLVTSNSLSKQFIFHHCAAEKMLCRRHRLRLLGCSNSEVNREGSNLFLFFLSGGHNYVHFISILCCAEIQDGKRMVQHLKKLSSSLKKGHSGLFFCFTKISQTKSLIEDRLANRGKAILIILVLLFEKYWGLQGIVLLPINEKTEGTRQNKVMYE